MAFKYFSETLSLEHVMTDVTDLPTAPQHKRRVPIAVAAVLVLLSLAAVCDMTGQCRTVNQRLLLNSGGCIALNQGGCLLLNEQRQRCELVVGDARIALSETAAAIMRKLRVPFFFMSGIMGSNHV
jgi:hypothetical protein